MYDFGQLYRIPTVIMRGGTSKGVLLRRSDLPTDPSLRDDIILRLFGSPDSAQIDGLGGGTSLTSKLALVGPPSIPGSDIDYTFGQVSIDRKSIDYHVTCGNFVTAVGLYAVEEGYVSLKEPITHVRIHNTNTNKIIVAEIPVRNGQIQYDGAFSIDGVPGSSSKIMLNFLNSGGTFTGKTLPTDNVVDSITIQDGRQYEVSIVDCANTLVFVRAADVGLAGTELQEEINANTELLNTLERIRVAVGLRIGLLEDGEFVSPTSHALPKICIVSPPTSYMTSTGKRVDEEEIDVVSRYISMGVLHRAHAVTGAIALATAVNIPGTIPSQVASSASPGVRIGHPSGTLYAEAVVVREGQNWTVTRAANGRTARRLMDGNAYIPVSVLTSRVKSDSHRKVKFIYKRIHGNPASQWNLRLARNVHDHKC